MEHRHLDNPGFTLAAIDDIIERGGLPDWLLLRDAARADAAIAARIKSAVGARQGEQSTISHDFWRIWSRAEHDSDETAA